MCRPAAGSTNFLLTGPNKSYIGQERDSIPCIVNDMSRVILFFNVVFFKPTKVALILHNTQLTLY